MNDKELLDVLDSLEKPHQVQRRELERPFVARLCPFCKTGEPELHVGACREQQTGLPVSALVYCGTCGAQGPTYVRPLVYLKGEAIDPWDPRERAVAAWNGEVEPEGRRDGRQIVLDFQHIYV